MIVSLYGSRECVDPNLVTVTVLGTLALFRATSGHGIPLALLVKAEATVVGQILWDISIIPSIRI